MCYLCIQYGIFPDNFRSGILVPIPTKTCCDTSEARKWRPIVISFTFSKVIELYVPDKCPNRGTNTATSLPNDVISYVTTCGSAV